MSGDTSGEGELFAFNGEVDASFDHTSNRSVWRILIAGDEEGVRETIKYALCDVEVCGRKIEFHDAYNSEMTLRLLESIPDVAVLLLDIVMEKANVGLDLISVIRNDLKMSDVRIVLRGDESNKIPSMDIIRDYDINDCQFKHELTQEKLFILMTSSIRAYKQICTIQNSKRGLDLILRASSELIARERLNDFSYGIIVHMASLLRVPKNGVVCVRRETGFTGEYLLIIAASGDYYPLLGKSLSDMSQILVQGMLKESLDKRCSIFHEKGVAFYLGSRTGGGMSGFVVTDRRISDVDQYLLKIFCGNISLCADSVRFLELLRHAAFTDETVGLPNRNSLEKKILDFINTSSSVSYSLALLDIDNFAEINAVLGQEYGDQLLRAVADRIRAQFAEINTVARVGGDVFAVFGPTVNVNENVILRPFVSPFEIGSELQSLSVSAGLVLLNEIDGSGLEVIKDASIALKKAKCHRYGKVVRFRREMVVVARERLNMLKNLRAAFEKNQLFLVFQPKLKLSNLAVTGLEALLRWREGGGNFVSPVEFIPLAEQSGLIIRLGEWVLRNAIAELGILRVKGYREMRMAVNISVAQLEHPDFMEMLIRVMGASDIHPNYIELEITESIAMGDIETNLIRLREIRSLGFKLSMDDFGTGFSSLTYLQKMPIDCLKIDRSFVSTSNSKSGREIVEMIVQLGKTLNLNIVAEGIEEEYQGALLRGMGCHEVQGFFYAKPMPREQLLVWLSIQKL